MIYELTRMPSLKSGYYLVKPPPGYPGRGCYPPEHRVVYWMYHGVLPPEGWHIHHINGDKLDNRIENLEALPASYHVKMEGHVADVEPEAHQILVCYQCQTEFQYLERRVRAAIAIGQEKFFCCKSCQITYQNQFKKGKKNNYPKNRKSSGRSGVMLSCHACSKEYYVPKHKELTSKTCSLECSYVYKSESRKGILCPNRKNKAQFVKLECAQCHIEFNREAREVAKSIKAGAINCFCSSLCTVIFNNSVRTAGLAKSD